MEYLISLLAAILAIKAIIDAKNAHSKVDSLLDRIKNLETQRMSIAETKSISVANDSSLNSQTTSQNNINVNNVNRVLPAYMQDQYVQYDNNTQTYTEHIKAEGAFSKWVKENWIMKLGVGLILIGFVWALNYAYQNKFIGNVGVSTLGILIGSCMLAFGFIRMKKYVNQGSIFMALGVAMIMLTSYFMKEMQIISSATVLSIIMLISITISSAAAVVYDKKGLAVATLVLSLFVPYVSSSGDNNYLGLYIYLLVVVIGTIWVVALKSWRVLTLISLIGVCIYSSTGIIFGFGEYKGTAMIFAFVFAIIFFITNTISILKLNADQNQSLIPDIISTILNAVMLISFVLAIFPSNWHAIILIAISLVSSFGAFLVYKKTEKNEPFFIHSAISIFLIGYATYLIFENNFALLSIVLTLEITTLLFVSYFLIRNKNISLKIMFLFVVPVILLTNSMQHIVNNTKYYYIEEYQQVKNTSSVYNSQDNFNNGFNNNYQNQNNNYSYEWIKKEVPINLFLDYMAVVFFVIVITSLTIFFKKQSSENETQLEESNKIQNLFFTISGIMIMGLIWGVSQLIFAEFGKTVAIIIYGLIGTALYVLGKNKESKGLKIFGIFLIIVTVLWLVFILSGANPIFRIVGFVVAGIIFLSSAFLLKNKN